MWKRNIRAPLAALGIAVGVAGAAVAQHAAPGRPYAGMEIRSIKALSDEQIADLLAGRGMSLALAAELNGYPGPTHVLELAERLGLAPEQRVRIEELKRAMTAETVPIGERWVGLEADLDRRFADRSITPADLDRLTAAIGETQGKLRAAHLRYHLVTIEALTLDQVARYGALRGYGGIHDGGHGR